MNNYRQFIVRRGKKPVDHRNGQISNGLSPEIWTTYDHAATTSTMFGSEYGVGFVLTERDPFFLIDLDHCITDETPNALALETVGRFAGCYTEISQSGDGMHIIGSYFVPIPPHRCRSDGMEFYHTDRMISLTNERASGDWLHDATVALGSLIRERFIKTSTEAGHWSDEPVTGYNSTLSDAELIERAKRSESNFSLLWSGSTSMYGHDHSAADQALCNHLMYWTGGDCSRVERLFEQSGLMREKWSEREDYRHSTILSAQATTPSYYSVDACGGFPDLSPRGVPLLTEENVAVLLERMSGTARYNLMRKIPEIHIPDVPEGCEIAVMKSEAEKCGMKHGEIYEQVYTISRRNSYCPGIEFITSVEWDGVGRMDSLVATLNPENPSLAAMMVQRWLIYAVNVLLDPKTAIAPGILVLQGDQGIGKTSWVSSLVEHRTDLFMEGACLNPEQVDSQMKCTGTWLTELGELERSVRYVNSIKAFVGLKEDTYRAPYERTANSYPRRTVFVGTVNRDDYLRDKTGNRRFLTVRCPQGINHHHDIDMRQLWAQVVVLARSGERSALNAPETAMVEKANEEHIETDAVMELLQERYDPDDEPKREMSSTEIARELGLSIDSKTVRNVSLQVKRFLRVSRARRSNNKRFYHFPPLK